VPCARGRAHRRLLTAPERVLTPLLRDGPRGEGRFRPASWDEALDAVAAHLRATLERHGGEAILHAYGAGSSGGRGLSGSGASRRLFSHLAPVTETAGRFSDHCTVTAARWMFGDVIPGSDRETLHTSRLIILWGMNPAETIMGPNTPYHIAEARDRGARVVLIDPRYTDSGVLADRWIPIRPGTDAALAAALAYVMEREGLVDRAFLARYTAGYDRYRDYLLGASDGVAKTPAWAAAITGVPEGTVVDLAREYATTKPAALLPGWAPQRGLYGEQAPRACITLACMTGNLGLPGGGEASVGTRWGAGPVGILPGGPYAPARTVAKWTWAAEISAPGFPSPIRLVYVVGTNLINRSPNTGLNARVLAGLDYVVVQDPFLTPTARLADVVLPACTDLERSDLVSAWGHDAYLYHSQQALEPAGETRTDYQICAALAERLGFGPEYTQGRSEEEWLAALLAEADLDADRLRREGLAREPHGARVALAEFRADPGAHPLRTPSGRVEIHTPEAEAYGLPAIPAYVPVEREPREAGYPLALITPHSKQRSHSCLHTNPWLQAIEPHAAWLHPEDAAARGIADGDPIEVSSADGVVRLPARVTHRIMPGVVCIYQGAWYRPDPDGVDVGACANTLTPSRATPSGGPSTHTAWVEVHRC